MKDLSSLKIVHIGLGKTATTTLQKHIFPEVCKQFNIKLLKIEDLKTVDHTKKQYHPLENIKNIALPESFLLSNEDLVGIDWRPQYFEKAFQVNKKIFNQDCKILITIRKPSEILNSTYITGIHNFNLIKEKDFFVYEKNKEIPNNKFNLYYFDYDKLINLYRGFYKNVIVVKYEEISTLNFLDKFFDINVDFKKKLQNKIKEEKVNKSFSITGVKIFFILNKFFNLAKFTQFISEKIYDVKYKDNTLLNRIRKKILAQLIIRNKVHQFDKIKIFYRKYKINKKDLPIDVDKLDKNYSNLHD